ncbi:MAG: hypothetical protein U0871_20270 [Gemmataceae bacterium]
MTYTDAQLNRIVGAVYTESELYGCMVGYQGGGSSRVLHYGMAPSVNWGRVVTVIESVDTIGPMPAPPAATDPTDPGPPPKISNRSVFGKELLGAGLSCGLTVLSGMAVIGGAAAEVPTGGASTALVVLGWGGLVTSSIQCGNALVRVGTALADPDDNTLQRWDDNKVYSGIILAVDGAGVVFSVVSLPFAVRNLLAVLERRGGMVAAAQLEKMTREERRKAIQKAVNEASKSPDGRKAVKEALEKAGLKPGQVGATFAGKAGNAERAAVVSRVLTEETARRLSSSIRDVVGGFGGLAASATPSGYVASASGSLNALIVHVFPGSPFDKPEFPEAK